MFTSEKYYYHHGVYLGECKVAHFAGANKTDAKPCLYDIFQFWKSAVDGKLYRVEYDEDTSQKMLDVEDTLRKAEEALAEPDQWPGYNIIHNNCESFAYWFKTGMKWSAQASAAVSQVVVKGAAAAVAGVIGSIGASACARR